MARPPKKEIKSELDAHIRVTAYLPGDPNPVQFGVKVRNAKGQIPVAHQNVLTYQQCVIDGLTKTFGHTVEIKL